MTTSTTNETLTLVILAAGMGSRYGGMKQLDAMGPNGETIMDYAIYDAIRAGFDRVAFVIREDFASQFKEAISSKYSDAIEVRHAYQGLDDFMGDYKRPVDRQKPWGTGHALLCAKAHIDGPYAVINADDFYGADGMLTACSYLRDLQDQSEGAMISYRLDNTLSDHGTVNRGVCTVDDQGTLTAIEEHTSIHQEEDKVVGVNSLGATVELSPSCEVSMNFWALPESTLETLDRAFGQFLMTNGHVPKSEFYLPAFIDEEIRKGHLTIRTLQTSGQWYGVTYQDDKPIVQAALRTMHGHSYPDVLRF